MALGSLYVRAISFIARAPDISRHGLSWIRFGAEGGAMDSERAIKTLCELIQKKTEKYVRDSSLIAKTRFHELILIGAFGSRQGNSEHALGSGFPGA
jgi:hypothetical protein